MSLTAIDGRLRSAGSWENPRLSRVRSLRLTPAARLCRGGRQIVKQAGIVGKTRIDGPVRHHMPGAEIERIGRRHAIFLDEFCLAVVISADLICAGVQSGCLSISSAAIPETCGVDIDVP